MGGDKTKGMSVIMQREPVAKICKFAAVNTGKLFTFAREGWRFLGVAASAAAAHFDVFTTDLTERHGAGHFFAVFIALMHCGESERSLRDTGMPHAAITFCAAGSVWPMVPVTASRSTRATRSFEVVILSKTHN